MSLILLRSTQKSQGELTLSPSTFVPIYFSIFSLTLSLSHFVSSRSDLCQFNFIEASMVDFIELLLLLSSSLFIMNHIVVTSSTSSLSQLCSATSSVSFAASGIPLHLPRLLLLLLHQSVRSINRIKKGEEVTT